MLIGTGGIIALIRPARTMKVKVNSKTLLNGPLKMINHSQKKEIMELVEELLIAKGNMDSEFATGHDWETFTKAYNDAYLYLEHHLETLTA